MTEQTMSAAKATLLVPQGMPGDGGVEPCAEVLAIFRAPDGSDLPVKITLFQVGAVFGVGVYPAERRGEVLRWHDGPEGKPRIVHWNLDGPACR